MGMHSLERLYESSAAHSVTFLKWLHYLLIGSVLQVTGSNHEAGGAGETLECTGGRATTGNVCAGVLCELTDSSMKVNEN